MDAALVSRLMHDLLGPSLPGNTLTQVLQTVSDQELSVQALAPILDHNQAYREFLLRLDFMHERLQEWAEEEEANPDREKILVERTLGLLGRAAIRNVVASLRMSRVLDNSLPRKESDKFRINAQDQLRFALSIERYVQDENMAYSDHAFVAGMHFDWLSALMAARKMSKDARLYLEAEWRVGFKTARIAFAIAGTITSFEYNPYVFGSGLLIHLGKVLMSILFPKELGEKSWASFLSECEKFRDYKDTILAIREKKLFPVTHAELASLYVSVLGFFRPVEKAICFYQNPVYLKLVDKSLFKLATILSVSESMAGGPPDRLNLNPMQRKCLAEMGIQEASLLQILKQASKERA